ncbi:MAG: lipid biosynthesis acyltransferase [Solimicrobium sp.]|jgi:KDO2-lipid IV(A) lauroyltransferase|nr:lipid biosynthesis acyltransferase [Solimicrobium sp.]
MLIAFFRFLSLLPLPLLQGIGVISGWLTYLLSPSYRHRLQTNIRQADFAEHTSNAVSEAGKSVLELPFIWYAAPKHVLTKAQIENWEVVQRALDAKQGVIFLTPHFGCFEIIPQIIAAQTPMTVLYRPPDKKLLQPLIENARTRTNLKLAPANLAGVRTMLKALKKGEAVGLLPDQVPQQGEGIWANFFGRPAYTMTLSFKLHVITGAPIILVSAERLSFGRGYIVRFFVFEPFRNPHFLQLDGTLVEEACKINVAMEKLIAKNPAQYSWSYNRYKTPANAPTAPVPYNEIKNR